MWLFLLLWAHLLRILLLFHSRIFFFCIWFSLKISFSPFFLFISWNARKLAVRAFGYVFWFSYCLSLIFSLCILVSFLVDFLNFIFQSFCGIFNFCYYTVISKRSLLLSDNFLFIAYCSCLMDILLYYLSDDIISFEVFLVSA